MDTSGNLSIRSDICQWDEVVPVSIFQYRWQSKAVVWALVMITRGPPLIHDKCERCVPSVMPKVIVGCTNSGYLLCGCISVVLGMIPSTGTFECVSCEEDKF